MPHKGTLICRPLGGLNDMLVQIEKCWSYALRSNRLLFIDTKRSGFLDSMDNYFCNAEGVIYGTPILQPEMTIFPDHKSLQNSEYKTAYNHSLRNFTVPGTEILISFDFSATYSQDILIHEQCGGGRESTEALKKLTLLPQISKNIWKTASELGDYDSIHVRNTDYKTDYQRFFAQLEIPDDRKIVLCTDDFACQEYAKSIWPNRVLIPNPAPQTNGKPLHMNPNLDRKSVNIAAITDLLLLASGKNLHYTKLDRGFISGFTRLALDLHSNPSIITHLLGKQE